MEIKNVFNNLFGYTPRDVYNFSFSNNSEDSEFNISQNNINSFEKSEDVHTDLSVNLDYIKAKYYKDVMVNSQILNHFVLEPLMPRNKSNLFNNEQNRVISESTKDNITVRKVKKFNLSDYIESCLIPQNNVEKNNSFEDVFSGVNSGNCALFVDTLSIAFDIDVKGFKQRGIDKPENEIVIKGAHEAFVENIRTNTSLLRRFTNNENLVIEGLEAGKLTKTKCAVCYMQNIANSDLVAEVKYRINNLDVDSILSSGQLEQLISDDNSLGLPKAISTFAKPLVK